MATVTALVTALLFGAYQPKYRLTCNKTTHDNGIFHRLSQPLRFATAKVLHPYSCLDSLNLEEDNRLLVATWPTYGNQSFIYVSGYAYALPTCAKDPQNRHGVFESCIKYLGGRVSDHEGYMPQDYLSHSIMGAHVTVSLANGTSEITDGISGEYGHFETYVAHNEPVGNTNMSVSTAGCPLSPSLQPVTTPTTAQILPPHGVTIVSDVDDILRECEVWNLKQMLLNTFARPFRPWPAHTSQNHTTARASGIHIRLAGHPFSSMPHLFAHWATICSHPPRSRNIHFHYVTEAPELSHAFYVAGLAAHFPPGSFAFRPMQLSAYAAFAHSRYRHIRRLIETFPRRAVVLLGDTATPGLLAAYARLAREFPQVECVLVRDTGASEPASWFAHDLRALPRERYVVFRTPRELREEPGMDVTALLRGFSGGKGAGTGCGGVRGYRRARGKVAGSAMWKSLKTGVRRYLECWVLTLSGNRPSRDCWFDRRGLLKYPPTTG